MSERQSRPRGQEPPPPTTQQTSSVKRKWDQGNWSSGLLEPTPPTGHDPASSQSQRQRDPALLANPTAADPRPESATAKPSDENVKRAQVAVALEDQSLVNKLDGRCAVGGCAIAGGIPQHELWVLPFAVALVDVQSRRRVRGETSASSRRRLGRNGIRRHHPSSGGWGAGKLSLLGRRDVVVDVITIAWCPVRATISAESGQRSRLHRLSSGTAVPC